MRRWRRLSAGQLLRLFLFICGLMRPCEAGGLAEVEKGRQCEEQTCEGDSWNCEAHGLDEWCFKHSAITVHGDGNGEDSHCSGRSIHFALYKVVRGWPQWSLY